MGDHERRDSALSWIDQIRDDSPLLNPIAHLPVGDDLEAFGAGDTAPIGSELDTDTERQRVDVPERFDGWCENRAEHDLSNGDGQE